MIPAENTVLYLKTNVPLQYKLNTRSTFNSLVFFITTIEYNLDSSC